MPTELATLAGGCFWCTEAVFAPLAGVEKVVSGYLGGSAPNPSYEAVCTGQTGHAEAVQITFDSEVIGYRELLEIFFATHDPTTLNRQGHDVGTQYRSAIFFHSPAQQAAAADVIEELEESKAWLNKIVTQVVPAPTFYPAEDYHQNYYNNNPTASYCSFVIRPKLKKVLEKLSKH